MESTPLSIVPFAEATFRRSVRMVHDATDGLSEDQVFWQPSSECNSMGWLAWHLTRRKDYYSAKLVDAEQTWVDARWFERFALTAEETGTGHSLAQVQAFRPSLSLLLEYVEAANEAALERLPKAAEAAMAEEVDLDAGRSLRPRREIWNPMLSDCLQHTGQIAYVRGLITGKGWFAV